MESKLIIPQVEFDRIEADALEWAKNQYDHDDVNKDYLEGALHEAMVAQKKMVDLDKELSALKTRCEKMEAALRTWVELDTPNEGDGFQKGFELQTRALKLTDKALAHKHEGINEKEGEA
jgi:hypothetical protein